MTRYVVAAFAPDGQRTGDTGRTFWTRWGADRERRHYASMRPVMVPKVVEGQLDWTQPQVPLVTYRVVPASG